MGQEDAKETKPNWAGLLTQQRQGKLLPGMPSGAGDPKARPLGSCSREMHKLADEKNRLKRRKITEA